MNGVIAAAPSLRLIFPADFESNPTISLATLILTTHPKMPFELH
jgi:hypothetical protein